LAARLTVLCRNPPRAVISHAEKFEPHMREAVEQAFGARAWNEYGSVENCALVTECEHGRLHVHLHFGILELIGADRQPVRVGGTLRGGPSDTGE
jgi:phenylacetate-CoA ligase